MTTDVDLLVEAIQAAGDDKARALEAKGMRQTENGWQEGDPLDQPEQDVAE